tara:strand:- start:667 stop:888 length:222 start_codon:yes stop_codon:yes gene_type:complete
MKVGDLILGPVALDKSGVMTLGYGLVLHEPYEEDYDFSEFDIHMEEYQLVGILFMDGTVKTMEPRNIELVSRV